MTDPEIKMEWEKEFDRRWKLVNNENDSFWHHHPSDVTMNLRSDNIKSFIRTLLEQTRSQSKLEPLDQLKLQHFLYYEVGIQGAKELSDQIYSRFGVPKSISVERIEEIIKNYCDGPYPVSEDGTDANGKTYKDFAQAIHSELLKKEGE